MRSDPFPRFFKHHGKAGRHDRSASVFRIGIGAPFRGAVFVPNDLKPTVTRQDLERLYHTYNRRSFVHPDPLIFLYRYDDPADREIVGLLASSLACGRVEQILRSVENALARLGPPAAFLRDSPPETLRRAAAGFVHRWTRGKDLAALLIGARDVIAQHGSLQACFVKGMTPGDANVLGALDGFALQLRRHGGSLVPSPCKGSACKRLLLFLRWMVRNDAVDPGGWTDVSPARLVVPLDVHMHRIARHLGLTDRKQADMRTALEITRAFTAFSPEDPVRYDFSLTRLGIRRDVSLPIQKKFGEIDV